MSKSTMTQYVRRIAKREGISMRPIRTHITTIYPDVEITNRLCEKFNQYGNKLIKVSDCAEAIHEYKSAKS